MISCEKNDLFLWSNLIASSLLNRLDVFVHDYSIRRQRIEA